MLLGALVIAVEAIYGCGVKTATGTLLIGAVIVLAGLLLHPWIGMIAAIIAGTAIISVRDQDILLSCAIFVLLSCIPWWFFKRIHDMEARTGYAEIALLRQKFTFAKQKRAQAKEMRKFQLEEMLYMYHFAELGLFGVVLLHDMANHLAILWLALEDLPASASAKTIKEVADSIGDSVESAQARLHGETKEHAFDMSKEVSETITFLNTKAAKVHVVIEWHQPIGTWRYKGDVSSLCQVIAIVVSNAIDAYSPPSNTEVQRVVVVMQRDNTYITIRVSDWGKGISKQARQHLFKPVQSTKKSGLGLGLYIAKQVIEMQFAGTISLDLQSDHTEFVIKIPIDTIAKA